LESEAEEGDDKQLITTLKDNSIGKDGLTKKAALFFDQDIFKDIGGLEGGLEDNEDEDEYEDIEEDEVEDEEVAKAEEESESPEELVEDDSDVEDVAELNSEDDGSEVSDDGIEIVRAERADNEWDADDEPQTNGRPGMFDLTHPSVMQEPIAFLLKYMHI